MRERAKMLRSKSTASMAVVALALLSSNPQAIALPVYVFAGAATELQTKGGVTQSFTDLLDSGSSLAMSGDLFAPLFGLNPAALDWSSSLTNSLFLSATGHISGGSSVSLSLNWNLDFFFSVVPFNQFNVDHLDFVQFFANAKTTGTPTTESLVQITQVGGPTSPFVTSPFILGQGANWSIGQPFNVLIGETYDVHLQIKMNMSGDDLTSSG